MNVKTALFGELGNYTFVVIFCRYQDKWLYCRAKDRDTFETAGGHIEQGESSLDAAKRELFEETGAIKYDIIPAFDYSVENQSGYKTGQVYLAHIHELGELQDYEMTEVMQFETIPEKMRFPQILPILYKDMQAWMRFM